MDYAKLAQSVGFRSVFRFDEIAKWRDEAKPTLKSPGPRFVSLCVDTALPSDLATSLAPVSQRLTQFAEALRQASSRG